ncbi:YhdP family protein [Undibacterium sp.]|uniref:YhdP family protein n=1 Tax=Undibacterium sp. TaxID=1914977 RepID=UPI002B5E249D|nr:YhdP family protein [Undibacterium sp.]HTD02468.1 YhdP family protein [Undibacterium sp.]
MQLPEGRWLGAIYRRFCGGCSTAGYACGRVLRIFLKILAICYFLFCALFLTLRYGVLPNIEHYKPQIEKMAGAAIGREVGISSIRASWKGLNPNLALGNVVLKDGAGKNALVLPDVSATLSWWSLLAAELRFENIEILKPTLALERQTDGRIYAAGFFIDPNRQGDGRGMDWVLSQKQIVIRDGAVIWSDKLRAAPELTLSGVNFVLNNRWRHHKFAIKATPPAALAAPVDMRGDFQHQVFSRTISDFSTWTGELFAELRQADLAAWKTYFDYPMDLQKGFGTVHAWLKLDRGHVDDLTADVKLSDVTAQFRKDLPVLDMAQVSGRLVASERQDRNKKFLPAIFGDAGHTISLINFSMQTRDGAVLPATTIQENFIPAQRGQPESVELYAKLLDLQTLTNFVEHLPLPSDQRQMLLDFSPQGQLKDFTAKWQGTYPAVSSYSVKGAFVNLSLKPQAAQLARPKSATEPAKAAVPAVPGFDHLSGSVDASDKGGSFTLDSANLSLQMGGYFIDPVIPFSKLQMQAKWQFEEQDKLLLQINQMDFEHEGMSGSLSGKYLMSMRSGKDQQAGDIDISGKLNGFRVNQIDKFIPIGAPGHLRDWLTGALLDGRADNVSLRIKGDLAHFPFAVADSKGKHQGEFFVKGSIVDGKLDFAPGNLAEDGKSPFWPVIENIKGSFLFERARMEIRADTAKTLGADLNKVVAVIPDLAHANQVLSIDGSASGNLQSMLQYVNASPVNGWIGHFLQDSKATGTSQLALKLQLPLDHINDSKVQGALQFANNDVDLIAGLPTLTTVSGKLEFNEKGVNLNTLKANLLGGAVAITGGTQKEGFIRVKADGVATSDGLHKAFPGTSVAKVADRIVGAARYGVTINVKKKQPEIIVESSLQGLALNFPAPLRKAANEYMPLRFELNPLASNDAAIWKDEIRISLGSAVSVRYLRQKNIDKNTPWQVLRGGIGVNAPAPEPDSGLTANIDFKALNVDEWTGLVDSISSSPAANAGSVAADAAKIDISAYVEPDVLAARTSELLIMGKKLDNVVVGASHQKGVWQANIDSRQASGYLTWNEGGNGQGIGNVTARLSNLIIPKSAATDVSDLLEGKNTTSQIPGLDIIAENFELFNKKLGRIELLASNVAIAAGREWRINKLSLKNPDAELRGSGKWTTRSGDGVTSLTYALDIADAGKLLGRMGFANVLRGGRGKLDGDVQWNGLPFAMDIPSMTGQLQLELAAGQFLKVDPGAAKLLGVLSLQSLPRRLTLDFRDVFSEGFAFDAINGTATLQQGVLKTDNLKMRSVNATVLMDGSTDISKESQNLHVAVIPEVNAGAASVVYGLAVNPVIGLGTFLAQLFLREPLARAFTFEYQISGPWSDPTVTKLDNKPGPQSLLKQSKVNAASN